MAVHQERSLAIPALAYLIVFVFWLCKATLLPSYTHCFKRFHMSLSSFGPFTVEFMSTGLEKRVFFS